MARPLLTSALSHLRVAKRNLYQLPANKKSCEDPKYAKLIAVVKAVHKNVKRDRAKLQAAYFEFTGFVPSADAVKQKQLNKYLRKARSERRGRCIDKHVKAINEY